MNKINFLLLFTLCVSMLISSCKKEAEDDNNNNNNNTNQDPEKVTDIDGNEYNTVRIGNQLWTKENLKTTRYNNGDSIPYIANNIAWKTTTEGARAFYEGNTAYLDTFGMLYNFKAIADSRNICPAGWHASTAQDWVETINTLGGAGVAGVKMKSKTGWEGESGVENNSSGFTALPGGYRDQNGNYSFLRKYSYFWATPEVDADFANYYNIDKGESNVNVVLEDKKYGTSCRCVKD